MKKLLISTALVSTLSAPAAHAIAYLVVPLDGGSGRYAQNQGGGVEVPEPDDGVLDLVGDTLPNMSYDTAYNHDFDVNLTMPEGGDRNAVAWALTGDLPDGVSFADGVLSGTPTFKQGPVELQLTANYGGESANASYTLEFDGLMGSMHANGVTVLCSGMARGVPFKLDGTVYFVADKDSLKSQVSRWCTSGITDMTALFASQSVDGSIAHFDTSNVTNMTALFGGSASFNQDISAWDTSNVTHMAAMFSYATSFNQDISAWNTSSVVDMSRVFDNAAAFNQNLSGWCTSNVTIDYAFDESAGFEGQTELQPTWGTCP